MKQNFGSAKVAITAYLALFKSTQGRTEWSSHGGSTLRTSFESGWPSPPAPLPSRERGEKVGLDVDNDTRDKLPFASPLSRRVEEGPGVRANRIAISYSSSKSRWMRGTAAFAFDDGYCEPAIRLAAEIGARGPVLSPVAACATGAHAIAAGAQLIQDGYADYVVAGAEEIGLPPLVMAAYDKLGALSRTKIMRPFDRRRDGFVPAQGSAYLVLENAELAQKRGAPIFGYLSSWSMHSDPHSMTAMSPGGEAIARAIESSLIMAGEPKVDYINAHGTATQLNDVVETRGIKSALGQSTPVSATKPFTGHLLGAAGAVEAVLCVMAMQENFAPPTLNLEEADEECDLDYIPVHGRAMPINCAISLNYGFGGHIGVLVMESGTTDGHR